MWDSFRHDSPFSPFHRAETSQPGDGDLCYRAKSPIAIASFPLPASIWTSDRRDATSTPSSKPSCRHSTTCCSGRASREGSATPSASQRSTLTSHPEPHQPLIEWIAETLQRSRATWIRRAQWIRQLFRRRQQSSTYRPDLPEFDRSKNYHPKTGRK